MTRVRIILMLVVLTLGVPAWADSSPEEDRAFQAASKSFDGEFWSRAEQEWRDFTVRFPMSPRVPEAALYQAQALVELKNYAGAIQLLQENLGAAGALTDEYLFWIAESHFRAETYRAAAQAFERVVREFSRSKRALESVLGQAASRARLKQWKQVILALQDPNGPLMKAPPSLANHLLLARGWLLLAEAYLATGDYPAARTTLDAPQLEKLNASLEWRKQYLRARTLLALGQLPEALAASSNLVSTASGSGPGNLADAVLFQGLVLENLGQLDQSVAAYRQNLSTNVPPAAQRQTLLRLSELLIANDRLTDARSAIEQFIVLAPDPTTVELARLTLAELKLRQYLKSSSSATGSSPAIPANLLEQVVSDLDEVIQSSSNRRWQGRAHLHRGWAEWMRGNFAESSTAFEQAASLLPRSEDQVTARFKWADARFRLGDFDGARTNYEFVVGSAPMIGGAALDLVESALYQTLRAGLEMDRPDLTTNVLDQLLTTYPDGFFTSTSVLLTGQELTGAGDPMEARTLFEKFLAQSPESPRASAIRLAIARTYEAEGNWQGAIDQYDSILRLTNDRPAQARAEYFRALDTAFNGNETNALSFFTNFVVVHATNELAPRAQWWIGDYHWRQSDFINAELNYQLLFKNWPQSGLAYEARMMAGRAAMARLSVTDAITYFTNLTSDLSIPPGLKPKAMFAYGDALMQLKSTVTNDPLANYATAIRVFSSIEREYPSNHLGALAQGKIGDCYLQLSVKDDRAYEAGTNAYQRVLENPAAGVSARSQAEWGLATLVEKQALSLSAEARVRLQQRALDHHLNVFYEKNLKEGERPDLFWVKKAGLDAGRLAEVLRAWPQALKLYERLQAMIPSLEPLLQNKILKAREQVGRAQT